MKHAITMLTAALQLVIKSIQSYKRYKKKAFASVANTFDYLPFKILVFSLFENVAGSFESVAAA